MPFAARASVHLAEPISPRLRVVTGALMLSMFLAATEMTFVTAAMPTIVTQLGGLEIYSWVFAGFTLSLTASVAVFGKLADLYGRRPIYLVAMAIFLVGSLLCGLARDMGELVACRILQGVGAGGLMPLVLTIIADVYSFEQRARMQGVFAGVWGVASVLGPILGGFLVDRVSWRWVFLMNVPAGLVAAAVLVLTWKETRRPKPTSIDYAGAALLVAAIVSLLGTLLAVERSGVMLAWGLAGLTAILGLLLARVERRAVDPVVPVALFRDRLFATACAQSAAAGFAVFGAITYIPFFVQFGAGVGATEAGASLTPMLLAWVVMANVGSRLLLRFPFRAVALVGMTFVVLGLAAMAYVPAGSSRPLHAAETALVGLGMGLTSPIFLIAVQTALPKESLGTATSTLQLSRSLGLSVGVAAMGAMLSARLGVTLGPEPAAGAILSSPEVIRALAAAERAVFTLALAIALAGWIATALAPSGRLGDRVER